MELGRDEYILIVSHDVVGREMAGPGIRYFHLARVLAREFAVLLAVPKESNITVDFPVVTYASGSDNTLIEAIRGARTIVVPAVQAGQIPALELIGTPIVIDGYDPFIVETLYLGVDVFGLQTVLAKAYLLGDFFLCASERQRDWWLGILEAYGRVNPYTFGEDPSLRRLVDVVPFGLPEEPPRATGPVIRGIWPGIGPEDKILLWGGGLWPWLDPLTAIRAVARVWQHRQDVRLIFPGTRHPNPWLSGISTYNEEARRLAQELGLLDRAVFFGEWVPYANWPGVLLESDLALTLHFDTLETRLAFRSRMLDYIWAGLPIIATRGDATSELVEKYGLGVVVDYEDDVGVAEAILRLLEMPKDAWAAHFERARQDLTWERAVQPLVEFCRNPRRAPDKVALGDRLGNPYYVDKIARLQSLVVGYERGRFIRMTRWLHQVRQKLYGRRKA
ncbi:MAG: glycosyltransferase [Candidatus Bathyarchaeia archaeon]